MNILIVDDERTVLRTVYRQLSEIKLRAERIDMADSAEEARSRMRDCDYDILLCDIVMPKEDGISLAKWVLDEKPETKIIFLTAYADIQYMKEAISMHSFDYVLQPVSTEELKNVVDRVISQINIEKKNRELIRTGEFFRDHEDDILEERARRFLGGEEQDNSYLRRLIAARSIYDRGESFYLPILVHVLKSEKKLEDIENKILKLIYRNILDEVFQEMNVYSIVLLEQNSVSPHILLYWKRALDYEKEQIVNKLETFRHISAQVLKTSLAIYCGDICEPTELAGIYLPLLQEKRDNVRLESGIYLGQNQKSTESRAYEVHLSAWKRLLDQCRFDEFSESIMAYVRNGNYRKHMSADGMMNLHQGVTQILLMHLVSNHIGSDSVFDSEFPYLAYMNSWQSVDDFEKAIGHITGKLKELEGMGGKSEDAVEKTIKYIREHLDRDVSVVEIAEYAGLNSEYLTKLFKKRTGYTLKEYITNEKMESAKMLLSTTNLSVTLVSDHVGYGNYSNFTRSFKKMVGCTPLEYRKRSENQKMQ